MLHSVSGLGQGQIYRRAIRTWSARCCVGPAAVHLSFAAAMAAMPQPCMRVNFNRAEEPNWLCSRLRATHHLRVAAAVASDWSTRHLSSFQLLSASGCPATPLLAHPARSTSRLLYCRSSLAWFPWRPPGVSWGQARAMRGPPNIRHSTYRVDQHATPSREKGTVEGPPGGHTRTLPYPPGRAASLAATLLPPSTSSTKLILH